MSLLLYPIIPAFFLGIVNYIYWSKRGYQSLNTLIIGILVSYALCYLLIKRFVSQ